MEATLLVLWFILRCLLSAGVVFGVIWLFWRYAFGGYYSASHGQRWPVWSAPGKMSYRDRPYTTRPPEKIARHFKYSDDEYRWEPSEMWGWIITIVVIACVTGMWWSTGYLATLF